MASKKDKNERLFMGGGTLPFTENVKEEKQQQQASTDLPFAENIENPSPIPKPTEPLPYTENIQQQAQQRQPTTELPYAENVTNEKAEETKNDITFMTNTSESVNAGRDIQQPIWRKIEWQGINLRNTLDSGELSCAKNLTTDEYPCLAPRPSRMVYKDNIDTPQALFAIENALIWVGVKEYGTESWETLFYDDGDTVKDYKLREYQGGMDRSMVDYNGKVLIFPDKLYLDYKSLPTTGTQLSTIGDGVSDYDDLDDRPYPDYKPCPNIDYVTVHNNRVFGVHEDVMYGNSLGKYDNWIQFDEVATDAWAVDVASNGDFKGITMYNNHVLAFKPDFMHEQWGHRPPYRVQDIYSVGTLDNRSIKEVDGVLFFCWHKGVYAYTGGKPELISHNLNKKYERAIAGTDGRKYYLSMYDGSVWDLFVFDTMFKLWTREDNLNVIEFAHWNNNMYALTSDGQILKFGAGSETVSWEAITEYYGREIQNKYFHEIRLRADIANGATLKISIQYDDNEFEELETYTGTADTAMRTIKHSIIPKDSYRYRIKFEGSGYSKIYGMEVLMSMGAE